MAEPDVEEYSPAETNEGQDLPPGRRHDISSLYELWTLDILPTIGSRAAHVFEAKPEQFKRVPPEIANLLARLHYRTGNNEDYLSTSQRFGLVSPLLGESDGIQHSDADAKFHRAAGALRQSAVDYVQRSFSTGERQLRNAFRDSAKTLYAYLTVLEGSVTTNALTRIEGHFLEVVEVLKTAEYCSGLGLPPAPEGNWPRFGVTDGDGAALISELTYRSMKEDDSAAVPQVGVTKFLAMQRAADYGAASLDGVLIDPAMDDDDRANGAIDLVYRWWQALRDCRSDLNTPS